MKTFFSANNVYFVKNKNIFSKQNFFFTLLLQQMNNHKCSYLFRTGKGTIPTVFQSRFRLHIYIYPTRFCEGNYNENFSNSSN